MCTKNSDALEALGLGLDALLLAKGLRLGKMPQKSERETAETIAAAIGQSVRMLEIYRDGRQEPIFGWSSMYDTLFKIDLLRETAESFGTDKTIDGLQRWNQDEGGRQFALAFFRSMNSRAVHVANHV